MSSSALVYLYPLTLQSNDLCVVELYRFGAGQVQYLKRHLYPEKRSEFVEALLDDGFTATKWTEGTLRFNRNGDEWMKVRLVEQLKILRELGWQANDN